MSRKQSIEEVIAEIKHIKEDSTVVEATDPNKRNLKAASKSF